VNGNLFLYISEVCALIKDHEHGCTARPAHGPLRKAYKLRDNDAASCGELRAMPRITVAQRRQ
jgi:hypothetical protein